MGSLFICKKWWSPLILLEDDFKCWAIVIKYSGHAIWFGPVLGRSWVYGSSVGWLENTRMSTQPIYYFYIGRNQNSIDNTACRCDKMKANWLADGAAAVITLGPLPTNQKPVYVYWKAEIMLCDWSLIIWLVWR